MVVGQPAYLYLQSLRRQTKEIKNAQTAGQRFVENEHRLGYIGTPPDLKDS